MKLKQTLIGVGMALVLTSVYLSLRSSRVHMSDSSKSQRSTSKMEGQYGLRLAIASAMSGLGKNQTAQCVKTFPKLTAADVDMKGLGSDQCIQRYQVMTKVVCGHTMSMPS
eukprot:TRINITY_DN15250_c0_g3_i2.p1 TRINITY_DN15250_c0_g3~~TRINITY_DN15250_c0_g3_i2.p1  ORF type:complete len:111 (+),score=19.63 TRINITY_DN15250_c0_g3_i2:140-472(+)